VYRPARLAAGLCLWILLALLGACTALGPAPDPELGRQHRDRAEQLIKGHDYEAAAGELAAAFANLPGDNDTALRYGEVLEALGKPRDAAGVYQKALLNEKGPNDSLRYRLALLQALQLDQLASAIDLHQQLSPGTFEAQDLRAVITLRQGHPRQALISLAGLAKATHADDQVAHIAYHATLAYQALGAKDAAMSSLYQAINHAENIGLIYLIKRYWEQPNSSPKGSGTPEG